MGHTNNYYSAITVYFRRHFEFLERFFSHTQQLLFKNCFLHVWVSCVMESYGSISFIPSFCSYNILIRSFCRLVFMFILAQKTNGSRCCDSWFAGLTPRGEYSSYLRLQILIIPKAYLTVD